MDVYSSKEFYMEVEVSSYSNSAQPKFNSSSQIDINKANADIDIYLLNSASANPRSDKNSAKIDDQSKALLISAQKIVAEINELLKGDLPDGIESLKPEDVTAEATADRIVTGSVAFFDLYAKQNPQLEGEELLNSFMSAITSGINRGYDDAFKTLEGLGAFEFEGVKEGVEKTKQLIFEKLAAFENTKRQELGLEPKVDPEASSTKSAKDQILLQASGSLNAVA